MDGRLLLVSCAAILGAAWLLGSDGVIPGGRGAAEVSIATGTPAGDPRHDPRHAELRRALRQQGYDPEDPASYLRERDGLRVVVGPVAATEHGRPVFIDHVVAGYHRPGISEVPGRVSDARRVVACRFSPPARGSRVANVFSNASPNPVAFYAFDAEELDPLALRYLEGRRGEAAEPDGFASITAGDAEHSGATKEVPGRRTSGAYQYSVTELVITETAMPVHLVLQGGAGRVLWNLHLAAGAAVSGVSLLGGHLPAVANLPRGVPVEALDDAGLAACGVTPVRLPLASDPVFAAVDSGALSPERARVGLAEMRRQSEAWNGWFEDQFGLRSDETRIGDDQGAIMAVVGPMPGPGGPPVAYRTLRDAPVIMAAAEEAFAREPGAAEARVARLARERAQALAAQAATGAGETTN